MADKTPEKKPNWFVRTSKRLNRWFREMRSELKKVVWPTFKQVVNNSGIVIVLVIIVALITALVDLGFNSAVRGIITVSHGNEPIVNAGTGTDTGDVEDYLADLGYDLSDVSDAVDNAEDAASGTTEDTTEAVTEENS